MHSLSGNRWMQKREVEKRMQIHWKNLEEKTSTGASWRTDGTKQSMLNGRRKEANKKEIHQVSISRSLFIVTTLSKTKN
jgi:hypothetical protein